MTKRQIKIISVPILVLVMGFALMKFFAGMRQDPSKMQAPIAQRFVRAVPVSYAEIKTQITAYGRIASAQSIRLTAEVAGKIIQGDVPFKAAQNFTKGKVIYRIDDAEFRLTIQAQKSEFINAVATIIPDLKFDFPNLHEPWEKYLQSINLNKDLPELPAFESAKEKTFFSARGILNRYYSIKSAEEKLKRHVFIAPYNGSIAEVQVETGSVVNPGTALGRIIRTDEMEAEIPVSAEQIIWLKKGAPVKLYSQDRMAMWEGKITRISDFVDQATQSINVYVNVPSGNENRIYEGYYLTAEIPGKQLENVMEIPRKALLNENEVFVVEDGKLKIKKIHLNKINPQTIIFSGLEEGELVVTESLLNAAEGMEVTVME
jgi:membrane fusion protein, multidrug efflux system